jgi:endonuclease YncB( thermonuclease family)
MKHDMNRMATRLIWAVLFCTSGLAHGEEFTAKIIAVLDGDTVLIKRASGLLKIRLAEIDAPEKAQTFGSASTQSLSGMVMGKQVKIASQTMDQYGRMVAHLSVDGLDVNAEQIRRGMAWEYSNFHSNKALIALQNEAKQAPRGLWAQGNPTPPWEWRKLHPSTPPAGAVTSAPPATPQTTNTGCGKKKHCSQMTSCEEAKFYLAQCGVKSLDGDGDGTPCESLCAPQKKVRN